MTTGQIQRVPERACPDEPEDSWLESDDSRDFDDIMAAEPSLMHDVAMAQLEGTLSWLGLPAHIADNLVRLVRSAVAHRPPDPSSTLPTLPP